MVRSLGFCVFGLLAFDFSSHASNSEDDSGFEVKFPKGAAHAETRKIKIIEKTDSVVFEVRDQFGIGKGSLISKNRKWPDKVILRFYLSGLEGLIAKIKGKTFAKEDLKIRMLDSKGNSLKGRYLLKGSKKIPGYFEIELPQSKLMDTRQIELRWIDFYRG
ncbi:MAG TPA: hypothetical protein EYG40_04750 [Verrucomicrobia bacterium]|nr:hypothetical protein [Verrucomicrobiales bacterium]HIL54327.1 hypothetical protein [Verrucomicrobiota bacterium]